MEQKIILLSVILGIILIAGCVSQYTGDEIQYSDMNEGLTCINTFDLRDKEFVVNSDEEYQTLLDYMSPGSRCENFELPSVDFIQKTLLGKYSQGGGCSVDFIRKVYKDDLDKKIIYSIEVEEKGLCDKLGASMNWVLIPKVSSDYSVEFEMK